jgi:hypothetical protein
MVKSTEDKMFQIHRAFKDSQFAISLGDDYPTLFYTLRFIQKNKPNKTPVDYTIDFKVQDGIITLYMGIQNT